MTRIFLIIPIALSVAGCPALDRIEGKKSEAQLWHERQNQVAVATELDVTPAPVAQSVALLAAVEAPVIAEPTCTPTFRVNQCLDGVSVAWHPTPDPEPIEVAEPLPVVVPVVEEPCYPIFRVRTCEEVTP